MTTAALLRPVQTSADQLALPEAIAAHVERVAVFVQIELVHYLTRVDRPVAATAQAAATEARRGLGRVLTWQIAGIDPASNLVSERDAVRLHASPQEARSLSQSSERRTVGRSRVCIIPPPKSRHKPHVRVWEGLT